MCLLNPKNVNKLAMLTILQTPQTTKYNQCHKQTIARLCCCVKAQKWKVQNEIYSLTTTTLILEETKITY